MQIREINNYRRTTRKQNRVKIFFDENKRRKQQ